MFKPSTPSSPVLAAIVAFNSCNDWLDACYAESPAERMAQCRIDAAAWCEVMPEPVPEGAAEELAGYFYAECTRAMAENAAEASEPLAAELSALWAMGANGRACAAEGRAPGEPAKAAFRLTVLVPCSDYVSGYAVEDVLEMGATTAEGAARLRMFGYFARYPLGRFRHVQSRTFYGRN